MVVDCRMISDVLRRHDVKEADSLPIQNNLHLMDLSQARDLFVSVSRQPHHDLILSVYWKGVRETAFHREYPPEALQTETLG